jgi:catechol 2,3-dioxygenase-like lactoylglutathione lyase family enzyme
MPLVALDHVNLRTAHLDALIRFYTDVLGLRVGPRPGFAFGGAWLYCGEWPAVHLVEVAAAPARSAAADARELTLQHFAFRATDLRGFLARLSAVGIQPRIGVVPDFAVCQLNVFDPDGNHVHVDFPLSEAVEAGVAGAV